ncbi:PKS-ER domain-containing protein [Fusarium keratoplasticum]|uniref:PKS-ER domain-containing protein n=1 Tax=Fusarium keratoplasticum TaxID=1328300 RepID=A0ACC0QPG6_9HYPO|nr:PKS-ER domain-containing protein [Fusarium keratoplasticum]KAI8657989.1 PKS-ER domain-containing protein [Fusarium keratoplasticum]KAI8658947.1 PKS-ER domain-containing protein [Fusarium keratoplasticum]
MSLPTTFKAATVAGKGENHITSERSLSPLKSGEVAIKITATAINPVDWKIRDYGVFVQEWPTVLGSDAAGEVVALGPDTSRVSVGDRVFFQGILGNIESTTFQQYCKMPEALLAKTPSSISDEQAAGIQLTTIAAVTAFYDKSGRGLPAPWDKGGDSVGKGKAVVILGGSSSVGQYAVQLARLSGFERIVTNASPAHHEHLTTLGAHAVLDRTNTSLEDYVSTIGDYPLEFVFDTIGARVTQKLGVKILQSLKVEGSRVATVSQADSEAKELGETKEPKVVVQGVMGFGSAPHLRYLSEPLSEHLGGEEGWIAKGLFTPNRVTVVPGGLDNIEEALAKNKRGVSGEKVVIRPWDKSE